MNQTVLRNIIAFILIASVMTKLLVAAPANKFLANNSANENSTLQCRLNELNHEDAITGRKSFYGIDAKDWNNSCRNSANSGSFSSDKGNVSAGEILEGPIALVLTTLNTLKNIDIKANETWYEFFGKCFDFLPDRPGGSAFDWHKQTQIYVATFAILRNIAKNSPGDDYLSSVEEELGNLFDEARSLLCEIENFVNNTMNGDSQKNLIVWYSKRKMKQTIRINFDEELDQIKTINLLVAAKFKEYIQKLARRAKHFDMDRNIHKAKKLMEQLENRSLDKNRKGRGKKGNRRVRLNKINKMKIDSGKIKQDGTIIVTTEKNLLKKKRKCPGKNGNRCGRKHQKLTQGVSAS